MAAESMASPALQYRKPAKLGGGPDFFAGAVFGIPKWMQSIMNAVITAEFQNIQCHERCSRYHPYSDGAMLTAPSTKVAYSAMVYGRNRRGMLRSAKVSVSG